MGSDVYGLPSQETYLDSQNIHLDAAKIGIISETSKFLRQKIVFLLFFLIENNTEFFGMPPPLLASTWYTSSIAFRWAVSGCHPSNWVPGTPCRTSRSQSSPAGTTAAHRHRQRNTGCRTAWKKFEALQPVYDSGDYYEGMWQLSIIGKGLKELPVDPETEVLRQQYEHWGELFARQEDEDMYK